MTLSAVHLTAATELAVFAYATCSSLRCKLEAEVHIWTTFSNGGRRYRFKRRLSELRETFTDFASYTGVWNLHKHFFDWYLE
jgi:hypothetical protein